MTPCDVTKAPLILAIIFHTSSC